MERKPKMVFQLDSPFTTPQWPTISGRDQETILELLCSLLSPIGRHRSEHVVPSKGRRSKKRKLQDAKSKGDPSPADGQPSPPPPPPDISPFVVVGLNSITRLLQNSSHLDSLESSNTPDNATTNTDDAAPRTGNLGSPTIKTAAGSQASAKAHLIAVFVSRSSLPAVLYAHLPHLIGNTPGTNPATSSTKLVQLPNGSDARLSASLGLARVSFVGILDGAPHSKALLDLVQAKVPDLEKPWLHNIPQPIYLPLKVNAIQTTSLVATKTQGV